MNNISPFQNITKDEFTEVSRKLLLLDTKLVVVNAGKASVNSGETVLSPDAVTVGIGVQRTTGER